MSRPYKANIRCEIRGNKEGGHHVYFNGIDISHFISKLSVEFNGIDIPQVVISIPFHEFYMDEEAIFSVIKHAEK